jgi:hypothetical protein
VPPIFISEIIAPISSRTFGHSDAGDERAARGGALLPLIFEGAADERHRKGADVGGRVSEDEVLTAWSRRRCAGSCGSSTGCCRSTPTGEAIRN